MGTQTAEAPTKNEKRIDRRPTTNVVAKVRAQEIENAQLANVGCVCGAVLTVFTFTDCCHHDNRVVPVTSHNAQTRRGETRQMSGSCILRIEKVVCILIIIEDKFAFSLVD